MILNSVAASILQSGLVPKGTRVEVFNQIYWVFLGLGTLVGLVVIGYMLKNAYTYRYRGGVDDDEDRPKLGEMPTGGGKGKKLFLSFTLSAIIVISLIAWTYGTLLYVEAAPDQGADTVDVEVVGYQFGWEFQYKNDAGETTVTTDGTLRVPEDTRINLQVTSRDVWHNFGIPGLKVKADAIPGEYTKTWFEASEPGKTYQANCYELCGQGHSYMTADIVVMEESEYNTWYQQAQANSTESGGNNSTATAGGNSSTATAGGNSSTATAGGNNSTATPTGTAGA